MSAQRFCVDCQFYRKPLFREPVCSHPELVQIRNRVTGKVIEVKCSVMRKNGFKCGPDADLYRSRYD